MSHDDGPLIDLLARSDQDVNMLTQDIDKSLFKESVTKHTNFSRGSININFKGNGMWGSTIKFTIPKNCGDLLASMYLNLKLPTISTDDIIGISDSEKENYLIKWTNYIGNASLDKIICRIGGQIIEEQYGSYMQIHTDLYDDDWNKIMMLGHDGNLNTPQVKIIGEELYIPLKFWFSESPSKALPLIALGYHDIEIEIKLTNFHNVYSILKKLDNNELIHTTKKLRIKQLDKISLETNMVYLSGKERKEIAKLDHEFLITQVQRRQININTHNFIEINFNHPVKELIYFIQPLRNIEQGEYLNFTSKLTYPSNEHEDILAYDKDAYNSLPKYHLLDEARILFNGKERVSWKNYKYYYYLQNYEHYRNSAEHYVYLYSFSMNPLSIQPSGFCNFSRLSNAQLQFKLRQVPQSDITITNKNNNPGTITVNGSIKDKNPGLLTVYATNYNYLIIQNGKAGLKYTN